MSKASRTVLLTLGRLPPAIEIARAFHSAGWRVIVADPFRVNMARTSRAVSHVETVHSPVDDPDRFRDRILELIERFDVDLVVPVSEETPWIAELKSAAKIPVFCGPPEQVLQFHSKLDFVQAAADCGLTVPSTCRTTDANAEKRRSAPFVVKPEFSCSGRDVTLHDTDDPIPERSENLLLQQRVQGDEVSCFSICLAGECSILVTYRAHTRHGSVAVCFERIDQPAAERWVREFVEATDYTGILSFDFIIDDAGTAWAIECNPRATSGIHFVAPEALYAAMVSPDSMPQIELKPYPLMQEFWSHWTHWFSVITDGDARRQTGRALRAARDVSWSAKDPWVFLLASFSTWPIIWRAIRHRRTFAEVLALDIEWRSR
ncbi:MAG: ATP-grasp domain-containing protein [Pseudomonadota bacterium]